MRLPSLPPSVRTIDEITTLAIAAALDPAPTGFGNGNPEHAIGAAPAPETLRLPLPATGGWSLKADNWKNLAVSDDAGKPVVFNLTRGKHELRLVNPTGALALDRFEFEGTGL